MSSHPSAEVRDVAFLHFRYLSTQNALGGVGRWALAGHSEAAGLNTRFGNLCILPCNVDFVVSHEVVLVVVSSLMLSVCGPGVCFPAMLQVF